MLGDAQHIVKLAAGRGVVSRASDPRAPSVLACACSRHAVSASLPLLSPAPSHTASPSLRFRQGSTCASLSRRIQARGVRLLPFQHGGQAAAGQQNGGEALWHRLMPKAGQVTHQTQAGHRACCRPAEQSVSSNSLCVDLLIDAEVGCGLGVGGRRPETADRVRIAVKPDSWPEKWPGTLRMHRSRCQAEGRRTIWATNGYSTAQHPRSVLMKAGRSMEP